jgi:hypothetical protein
MGHGLPEWLDLDGRLTRLQEIPIALQFVAVNLRPRLHEPLLGLWQATAQTFDRIQRENRCLVLVVRVKVWAMMGPAGFNEHPNDDSEEPRQLGHSDTLHRLHRFIGPTPGCKPMLGRRLCSAQFEDCRFVLLVKSDDVFVMAPQ